MQRGERVLRRAGLSGGPAQRHGGCGENCGRLSVLLGLFLLALPGPGAQASGASGDIGSGTLLLHGQGNATAAMELATELDVEISGIVARVRLVQTFRNTGLEWVEGEYLFPLPEGATLDGMRVITGDKEIIGEIRERRQARRTFEQARASGRRAAIVEQGRSNLFTLKVSNIGPGAEIRVELGYLDTVRFEGGEFGFRFPMTLTPRYAPASPVPGIAKLTPEIAAEAANGETGSGTFSGDIGPRTAIRVRVNAGLPMTAFHSTGHAIDVSDLGDAYHVELAARRVVPDRDFVLHWRPVATEARPALYTEYIGGEAYALLTFLPPQGEVSVTRPRELIMVVDTSGSMHGASLEQAKAAVLWALDRLDADDHFNVVQFNNDTESLFPASVPATGEALARARLYVSHLGADGGTEMGPAIYQALNTPSAGTHLRQVVFVTDGAVANEEELFALIGRYLGEARLFTVGIGSAPNGYFLRRAARRGRGSVTTIGHQNEVRDSMMRLFTKLESPVVTDLEIDWPGTAGHHGSEGPDMWPARIPDLYAGEPVVVSARLGTIPAGDTGGRGITVTGRSNGEHWVRQIAMPRGIQHAGVAKLWARKRIDGLLEELRRGGDADVLRAEAIDLALQHGVVSRFTSLIAVERQILRPGQSPLLPVSIANARPAGQAGLGQTLTSTYPATATAATRHAVVAVLALMLAAFLLIGRRYS